MTKVQQTRLVPFDIKYRKQIESGIYRVFTRDKHEARIICWDAELEDPDFKLVAIVNGFVESYTITGKYYYSDEENEDLFVEILIEEEENYTEFESELLNLCKAYKSNSEDLVSIVDFIKYGARKLLTIANKSSYTSKITENIKEGIIL
jgi:hypothetical protein